MRNAAGEPAIVRRRDIRPTGCDAVSGRKFPRQETQPVNVGIGVIVDIRNNFPTGRRKPDVAGAAQPLMIDTDYLETKPSRNVRRTVHGPIVNDNHLELLEGL